MRVVEVWVTCGGECLGVVGPLDVASPWWADVEPVVEHLRDRLGVPVVVLRLVDVVGGESPRDGHVTYHAEALDRPPAALPHPAGHDCAALRRSPPGRAPWATPDGVRAALAWAHSFAGTASGDVHQIKTWNLSAVFRIGTDAPVWLKITPAFAAHEPDVFDLVARVDPGLVPLVIASDSAQRRTLMENVPGEDCWDAGPRLIRATVTRWVAVQAALAGEVTGVPDRRPGSLPAGVQRLLDGDAGRHLDADERRAADVLVAGLPGRIAELEACGLPDTLVHGDFHPGNWRADGSDDADGDAITLMDFADAYYGHPAFDGERLRGFVTEDRRAAVVEAWCAAWRSHLPHADPERALELARPLQALSGAVLYQMFLDHIETSERPYHEADPVAGIRAALRRPHMS